MIEPRVLKEGEKITENGLYALTMEQHHGQPCDGPSVTSSVLRTVFKKSLKHLYMTSAFNPKRVELKPTGPMILGRAAHLLFCGEGGFSKYFIVQPETYEDEKTGEVKKWNGNANVCKRWLAEAESRGLEVLTQTQFDAIVGMKGSIASNPMAPNLLTGGVELTVAFKDKENDLWCLSRPDALTGSGEWGADLKCVNDVTDAGIARAMRDGCYHQQAALADEAFEKALGIKMEAFAFIFAEYNPPYCVRVETLDPEDLALGHEQNRLARKLIRKCLDTGEWPGPQNRYGDGGYFKFSENARSYFQYQCKRIEEELAA